MRTGEAPTYPALVMQPDGLRVPVWLRPRNPLSICAYRALPAPAGVDTSVFFRAGGEQASGLPPWILRAAAEDKCVIKITNVMRVGTAFGV